MAVQQSPPTRNILLAIDGSDHAQAAVKLIQNLPLPETCHIAIVTVVIPRNAHLTHTALEQLMAQTKNLFQNAGRAVSTHMLSGNPASKIIEFSQEHNTDLIVLGAKGLRGTFRILLGGVAQQVVEYAHSPVLIVRAPHTQAQNVLLVTDGSDHSWWAVQHLDLCPLPPKATLTLMNVLPPEITSETLMHSWPYGMEVIPPVLSEDVEENLAVRAKQEEQLGRDLLEKSKLECTNLGLPIETVLRRGDTATEVLEYAAENNIDLIITGSRGLSQAQSWLLGSVTSKLTHYADCSVFIVKHPQEDG